MEDKPKQLSFPCPYDLWIEIRDAAARSRLKLSDYCVAALQAAVAPKTPSPPAPEPVVVMPPPVSVAPPKPVATPSPSAAPAPVTPTSKPVATPAAAPKPAPSPAPAYKLSRHETGRDTGLPMPADMKALLDDPLAVETWRTIPSTIKFPLLAILTRNNCGDIALTMRSKIQWWAGDMACILDWIENAEDKLSQEEREGVRLAHVMLKEMKAEIRKWMVEQPAS
jgi:hypothetical protein